MNKNDLIARVAGDTGLSKPAAGGAVDSVIRNITEALKAGDDVRLIGFGNFTVAVRPAGEGRNPRTGEKIRIGEARQPKFKAGKTLKDALN